MFPNCWQPSWRHHADIRPTKIKVSHVSNLCGNHRLPWCTLTGYFLENMYVSVLKKKYIDALQFICRIYFSAAQITRLGPAQAWWTTLVHPNRFTRTDRWSLKESKRRVWGRLSVVVLGARLWSWRFPPKNGHGKRGFCEAWEALSCWQLAGCDFCWGEKWSEIRADQKWGRNRPFEMVDVVGLHFRLRNFPMIPLESVVL